MKICFKTLAKQLLLVSAAALFLASCLNDSVSEPEIEEPDTPLVTQAVSPDGILETVTWNLERYGSDLNSSQTGIQRTKNILRIADSLKADLYALQEVTNQQGLDSLTKYMTGFNGFVSEHTRFNEALAFVYNTETIDSVSSGAITQNQDDFDWASGRYPFFFAFNYEYQGSNTLIYAVTIHAKANTGDNQERQEAYERRVRAAESLYTYLQNEQPDAHIILLGDFNDDVDVSIYDDALPSPYDDFVSDGANFRAVTESISEEGQSSYIAGNYNDLIDHIVISDELFSAYTPFSEEIYFEADSFIDDYVNTTSDHLPVWAKFDMTLSSSE